MTDTCPTCLHEWPDRDAIQYLQTQTVPARNAAIKSEILYQDYWYWCDRLGRTALSKYQFLRSVTRAGYPADRTTNGVRVRRGLHLRVQD